MPSLPKESQSHLPLDRVPRPRPLPRRPLPSSPPISASSISPNRLIRKLNKTPALLQLLRRRSWSSFSSCRCLFGVRGVTCHQQGATRKRQCLSCLCKLGHGTPKTSTRTISDETPDFHQSPQTLELRRVGRFPIGIVSHPASLTLNSPQHLQPATIHPELC